MEIPDALVLAGGLGSRLQGVVIDRQKVVASVLGRPFLAFILARLEAAGVRHAVLCTGYRAASVEAMGDAFGSMRLSYSREERQLGTGGALRRAVSLTETSDLLVVNGDSLCVTDLGALVARHRSVGSVATLLAVAVPNADRYGCLDFREDGRVLGFREKGAGGAGWVSAGIYVLERKLLVGLSDERELSLEREVFPLLTDAKLSAHAVEAPFLDIGTPESYAEAERFLSDQVRDWSGRRFVVLDRDGTVVRHQPYLSNVEDVALVPCAGSALRALVGGGFGLVLVTNQSGVGRGYFDLGRVEEVHARIVSLLGSEGVMLDGIFVCPHRPEEGCGCRKPRAGLLRRASHELGFDPCRAIVVGDDEADVGLGRSVGAATVLVRTGHGLAFETVGRTRPDLVVDDLAAAAVEILADRVHPVQLNEENR